MKKFKRILTSTFILSIFVVLLTALPASTALADVVGPNNPAVGTDVATIGTVAWENPGNISQLDSAPATATMYGRVTTHYLQGTQYGFNIPTDATIRGIELTVTRRVSDHNAGLADYAIRLVKGGEIMGENKAITNTIWTTVFTTVVYGGPLDLWGSSWTPADVNAMDFGAALSVNRTNNGSNNRVAEVDSMQITVYYGYDASVSVSCGDGSPVVYGDSVACTATVTRLSGDQTPEGLVNWSSDGEGTFDPNPCTLEGADGTASCTAAYTPASVGSGTHLVTADYDGGQFFAPGSSSQAVSVLVKPITVTADPQTKQYGSPDPTFTYTYTPTLAFSDTFTGTLSRDPGEEVGQYAITQGSLALNENYDLTYVGDYLDITPADAICTVDAYDVTYDGSAHTASGTCTGIYGEDLAGLDLSGTNHTDAGV